MPTTEVTIDWPTDDDPGSPPGVRQSGFTATGSVVVDDESKFERSTNYKVVCKLFQGTTLKSTADGGQFDPVAHPEWSASSLSSDVTGSHLLRADFMNTTTNLVLDFDEVTIDLTARGLARQLVDVTFEEV